MPQLFIYKLNICTLESLRARIQAFIVKPDTMIFEDNIDEIPFYLKQMHGSRELEIIVHQNISESL